MSRSPSISTAAQTAETPDAAQALMSALFAEPDAARNNLRQAYDYLEKYAFAPRIASIGWCLGGGWSLQTASAVSRTRSMRWSCTTARSSRTATGSRR